MTIGSVASCRVLPSARHGRKGGWNRSEGIFGENVEEHPGISADERCSYRSSLADSDTCVVKMRVRLK